MLGILLAVFALNFMDRQILAILLQPIKEDLALSDAKLVVGNLIGLGLGPVAVGALSDLLQPHLGADSLCFALLIAVPFSLRAAFHSHIAGRTLGHDLACAQALHAVETPAPAAPVAISPRTGIG